ncbi:MAG: LptF/LptG family permease, partial [Gammaproteobacteria bacterium]|nr:LptF/LptG family permease [Gammaproteobacteria bacterium]
MRINRKIFDHSIIKSIMGATIGFVALFYFFDMLEEIKNLDRYGLKKLLINSLFSIPQRVYELLPISVVIGASVALVNLTKNLEYVVLRVSGFNPYLAIKKIGLIGGMFAMVGIIFGEILVPSAMRLKVDILSNVTDVPINDAKFWIKDLSSGNHQVISAHNMSESLVKDINIFEYSNNYEFQKIISAKEGLILDKGWKLFNGKIIFFNDSRLKIEEFHEYFVPLSVYSDILRAQMEPINGLNFLQLMNMVRFLEKNQLNILPYSVSAWSRISYPFSILLMAFLALPFAYTSIRDRGGVAKVSIVATFWGLTFYLLNHLF